MSDTSMQTGRRVAALDGLRGWASLSVVLFHLTSETFGVLFPEMRAWPLALVAQGDLSVCIFLALSGYVLTAGTWAGARWTVPLGRMARRYPRLMIPVLAAVLITYALYAIGWTGAAPEAFAVVGRLDWMEPWLNTSPTFAGAVGFAAFDVFIGARNYGLFLWTMYPELWGSIVLLLLATILRYRWPQLVVLGSFALLLLLKFDPFTTSMCLGALVACLRDHGWLPRLHGAVRLGIIATAVAIGAWVHAAGLPLPAWLGIAGAAIVAMVATGPVPSLEGPLSQWLGRVSFPLYIIQFPIIITLTAQLIRLADQAGALNIWMAVGIAAVSLAACLAAAVALLPIETFTLWVCRQIARPRFRPASPSARVAETG